MEGVIYLWLLTERHRRSHLASDNLSKGVLCPLVPRIWDITKRLPRIMEGEDCHLLLLFHVGLNDAATKISWNTRSDFMSPGKMFEELGEHLMFCSVLPKRTGSEAGWDEWLGGGLADAIRASAPMTFMGCAFGRLGILTAGGVYLTKWHKSC